MGVVAQLSTSCSRRRAPRQEVERARAQGVMTLLLILLQLALITDVHQARVSEIESARVESVGACRTPTADSPLV